jgi:hypothetical protein
MNKQTKHIVIILLLAMPFLALPAAAQTYDYDVNNDGVINMIDALLTAQYIS